MLLNLSYFNPCVVNYSSEKSKPHEMLVLYDFTSRNSKELTVRKGDIVEASIRNHSIIVFSYNESNVFNATNHRHYHYLFFVHLQLLDKTNQWWKVRDSRGVEGYVPNNVLKANEEQPLLVSNIHHGDIMT